MKQVTQFIEWLRYCCATLANTDSDCKSFDFALQQTKEALDKLKPQPYVGATCGLPPATLFSLLEKFEQLEKNRISVTEFCTNFKLVIEELDRIVSSKLSLDNFDSVLAEFLLALSDGREVDSILERLSGAFSNLPSEEKERLLSHKQCCQLKPFHGYD